MDLPHEIHEYPNIDTVDLLEVTQECYEVYLFELPEDILYLLNTFLGYQDIRRYAQTCKHINKHCQPSILAKREALKPLFYNAAMSPHGESARIKVREYLIRNHGFRFMKPDDTKKKNTKFFEKQHRDKLWGISIDTPPLYVYMPINYFETADEMNGKLLEEALIMIESGCVRFTCICGQQVHMVDGTRFGGGSTALLRHFESECHKMHLFAYNYIYLGDATTLAKPYGQDHHRLTHLEEYVHPKGYLTVTV